MEPIDWNNPNQHITEHFTVREALLLPRWNLLHMPSPTEQDNIVRMAGLMESVREVFDKPLHVHCWIRPERANLLHPANGPSPFALQGASYNALVGGASTSWHRVDRAVDFHVDGMESVADCHKAREILLPLLKPLGLRMEDKEGGWVHLDNGPVGASGRRFFKP